MKCNHVIETRRTESCTIHITNSILCELNEQTNKQKKHQQTTALLNIVCKIGNRNAKYSLVNRRTMLIIHFFWDVHTRCWCVYTHTHIHLQWWLIYKTYTECQRTFTVKICFIFHSLPLTLLLGLYSPLSSIKVCVRVRVCTWLYACGLWVRACLPCVCLYTYYICV